MEVKENIPKTDKNYELLPPDGGWGYVICVGVTINFIAATSFTSSFGIIYDEFFIRLGMGSTDVSLLAGISAMSLALAGFLSGPLLKTMSLRKLCFIASAVFNAGVIGTIFVKTQAQLIIFQGLAQNFGMGLLFTLSSTALNDYFKEKRLITISAVNTATGAAAIVAPMIVDWMTRNVGFNGTLIFIAIISATTFIGSSVFQPVAWHMRKVEIDTDVPEMKLLLENSNNGKDESLKTPVIKVPADDKDVDLFPEETKNIYEDSLKGNAALNFIKTYLDWPLIKEYMSTVACYGIPICMFTDNTYTFFLPQALYARNWSHESVAWAFSLQAFGDIATRVLFMFSSSVFKKLGSRGLYVIGIMIGVVTKLALIWVTDHTTMLVIITVMGASRCSIVVLFPLVVTDSVKPQLFAAAMGISMLIFGITSLVLGPATGAIRDATGDYSTMFYILIFILTVVALAMSYEAVVKRRKSKQESMTRK